MLKSLSLASVVVLIFSYIIIILESHRRRKKLKKLDEQFRLIVLHNSGMSDNRTNNDTTQYTFVWVNALAINNGLDPCDQEFKVDLENFRKSDLLQDFLVTNGRDI